MNDFCRLFGNGKVNKIESESLRVVVKAFHFYLTGPGAFYSLFCAVFELAQRRPSLEISRRIE